MGLSDEREKSTHDVTELPFSWMHSLFYFLPLCSFMIIACHTLVEVFQMYWRQTVERQHFLRLSDSILVTRQLRVAFSFRHVQFNNDSLIFYQSRPM